MRRRRFRCKGGFNDNTLYIEVNDDGSWNGEGSRIVLKNGNSINSTASYTLKDCVQFVNLDLWIELDDNQK